MTRKPWAVTVFPSPNHRLGLVPALLVPCQAGRFRCSGLLEQGRSGLGRLPTSATLRSSYLICRSHCRMKMQGSGAEL